MCRTWGSGYWGFTTALVPLGSFVSVETVFVLYNRKKIAIFTFFYLLNMLKLEKNGHFY